MSNNSQIINFILRCGVRKSAIEHMDFMTRFLADLQQANSKTNLTRITNPEEFWLLHIADCLAIGNAWPEIMNTQIKIADVGCGAGFPTIPLAWANPELQITAIEARQKKADFVTTEIHKLGLQNCNVIPKQVSEAARMPELKGQFDLILMRAVGSHGKMIRNSRHLLNNKPHSGFIFYQTPNTMQITRAILQREAKKLKLILQESPIIELPHNAGQRCFSLLIQP